MRRLAVPGCVALLAWCAAGCEGQGEPGGVADGAGRDAAVVDPHCADGDQVTSVPKGPCVIGASCAITLMHCAGDPSSKRPWFCECPVGDWQCAHSGTLDIYICDSGVDAHQD
ncbi:MAG: hypothetical protein KF718_05890 [Polyangiaceae bacterium]|nr:hypothetical protein [Polyangiaceae bacterium]